MQKLNMFYKKFLKKPWTKRKLTPALTG